MLAGQIFAVEEALGVYLQNKTDKTEGIPITKFQSLDFARQSLEDCALLVYLLSDETAAKSRLGNSSVSICEKLKLDATRELVASDRPRKIEIDSGDVDLF